MIRVILNQFLRFGLVGTAGFVVDGGLLYLLLSNDVNAYFARALSFPVALLVTWQLNRTWTFPNSRKHSTFQQINAYIAVQVIGALANYCCYVLMIAQLGSSTSVAMFAFMIGSIFGMFINFTGAKLFVFKK